VDEHAGRGLGAPRLRQIQGAIHLLRRPEAARRNLRAKYDVIVFPHAGQGGAALINSGVQGTRRVPIRKPISSERGAIDSTDDMRGSIGVEGLMELYKFVQQVAC
jgi:hypothetical protein